MKAVILCVDMSPEFVWLFLGISIAGAVVCCLSPDFSKGSFLFFINKNFFFYIFNYIIPQNLFFFICLRTFRQFIIVWRNMKRKDKRNVKVICRRNAISNNRFSSTFCICNTECNTEFSSCILWIRICS